MNHEKEFKSFFKTVGGNEGSRCNYPTRLDLYGCGCAHDCDYCYAKSLLDFRKLWNPAHPTTANWEKVARVIRRKVHKGDVVRLGGMTDCFQPLEASRRMTWQAIKELNKVGAHYLIVTKSDLVATKPYLDIMDRNLAHIQISVTFTDDEECLKHEKATSPSRRIKAIETLYKEGFDVSMRLSPLTPEFIDFDVVNSVNCEKVLVEFLRVNTWIKRWFDIDYTPYTLTHAGYKHLPLERKKEILSGISPKFSVSVCEDVPEHWEYWKKNVNANSDDCCNLTLI